VTLSVPVVIPAVEPDQRSVAPVALRLPSPPSDAEKTSYFGRQYRWISLVSYVGFLLIFIGLLLFVWRRPWAVVLMIPLVITAIGASVSLITGSRARGMKLSDHRKLVDNWSPDIFPPVDVFLPSAGEQLEVLRNTYLHVKRLSWPAAVEVWVLDDSGRDEVRELAEDVGFHYRSRPDRGRLKKAGNLEYGYDQSDGDLIVIFDADFVPRPDFLTELAPYFDDPRAAIVQSPQFFDLAKDMNWLERAAGATQVLFYSWVQPSRDRFRAAICVGTSAMYRRSALIESGGFAQIGHSEDVHTGVNLIRAGYDVRYVPIVVSKGLCPSGFDQFVTQQYRWCTGSMSLLFSRGFHRMKLSRMQRLCYWSGFLYYITTAVNVFASSIPPILMGFFAADRVQLSNYVFVFAAMVCRQAVVPIISRDRESLLGLTRIQTTYSFAHALALWDVLRKRTDSWVATGDKRRSRTAVRVGRIARWWTLSIQALLWIAILIDVPRYGLGAFWPMILLAVMNLYIVLPIARGDADAKTTLKLPRSIRVPGAKVVSE